MSYLRTFLPWIAFAVFPNKDWQWAALCALAICVVVISRQTRAGVHLDALVIEIGSAAYFAALSVLAFGDPHTSLHAYTASMANGALGLIALISLAVGKPFTLGIAKQQTPREFWNNPVFIRTNVIITAVWTVSFIIGCAVLAFIAHSSELDRSIVQVVSFVIPMTFTVRYAAYVKAKSEAAIAAMAQNGPAGYPAAPGYPAPGRPAPGYPPRDYPPRDYPRREY
jgi:hypothetical protein